MFRYERPQKGRYRQFHQLDVEAFGVEAPALDAEVIEMAAHLVAELGIADAELVINTVGCPQCRPAFSRALLDALGDRVEALCGDCRRRARTNPLRIFDCKQPACQPVVDALPHTVDYLCAPCREHFAAVRVALAALGVACRVSHRLVRGLDYYRRTTFEILGQALGAQDALLGGGRYDGLVRQLGGPDRAGIGFAAGLERLVLAMPPDAVAASTPDAYVVAIGDEARQPAQVLARDLRHAGLCTLVDYDGRSPRSQMKRAGKAQAGHVLILGADELAGSRVSLKDMTTGEQEAVPRGDIVGRLRRLQEECVAP